MSNLTDGLEHDLVSPSIAYKLDGSNKVSASSAYADYSFASNLSDASSYGNTATYTRASQLTVVYEDGTSGAADLASNVAGFPGAGVLIEPDHTNALTYSREFDNAAWSKQRASISANATTAPDGTSTGDMLIEDTSTNTHRMRYFGSHGTTSTYFVQVYVKDNGRDKVQIQLGGNAGDPIVDFDLTAETATTVSGVVDDKKIRAVGNGWYECALIGKHLQSTGATVIYYLQDSGGNISYTGDGSSGMYFWQADHQHVTSSGDTDTGYASPIETVASTASCAVGNLSIPASHFPVNDFVINFDYKLQGSESTAYLYSHMSDANNGVNIYWFNGDFVAVTVREGVFVSTTVAQALTLNDTYAITLTMSSTTGLTLDIDGTDSTDATSLADLPASNATAILGSDLVNANHINGQISNFTVKDI